MPEIKKERTKLERLLKQKGLSYDDFYFKFIEVNGRVLGRDRISRMVSGKITNYSIDTAKAVAKTLGVSVDDIIED